MLVEAMAVVAGSHGRRDWPERGLPFNGHLVMSQGADKRQSSVVLVQGRVNVLATVLDCCDFCSAKSRRSVTEAFPNNLQHCSNNKDQEPVKAITGVSSTYCRYLSLRPGAGAAQLQDGVLQRRGN